MSTTLPALNRVPPALCHTLLTPASCSLHFACTSRPSAFKPICHQAQLACACPPRGFTFPPPRFFHILFSFLCIVINCVLNHFATKCDLFALAPLGLPLILRKEKLFSLYPLIRQTPRSTCPARGASHFRRLSAPPRTAASLIFIRPRRTLRHGNFLLSAPPLQKTPASAPTRHVRQNRQSKSTIFLPVCQRKTKQALSIS